MEYAISAVIGYGLGCLNPAYFISKFKKKDIRKSGTGNLGTTNTFLNFGRGWGIFVLFFDIFKAFFSVVICKILFPTQILTSIVSGISSVLGHIFPFYTKFKGGKGIASFGGMVLGLSWQLFLMLLVIGLVLMFVFDYGCTMTFSATILFPILYGISSKSIVAALLLALCSAVVFYKHLDTFEKIKQGKEVRVRSFFKKYLFGK